MMVRMAAVTVEYTKSFYFFKSSSWLLVQRDLCLLSSIELFPNKRVRKSRAKRVGQCQYGYIFIYGYIVLIVVLTFVDNQQRRFHYLDQPPSYRVLAYLWVLVVPHF